MKELSIEEKAKRYDEALERARIWKDKSGMPKDKQSILDDIFPELKESEDKRIRQKFIHLVKMSNEVGGFALHKWEADEMLAWLEEQAEHANFRNKIQIGDKVTRNKDGVLVNLSQLNRVAKKDEKQGEQKPDDKVEPKFHEGDWIVFNGFSLYVKEVVKGYYRTISKGGIVNSYDWNIDNVARLWTIQDAKDGDVLATDDGNIFVFDGTVEEGKYPFAYYGLTRRRFESYDRRLPFTHNNVYPATKEQRDTLMKAMTDAGYTFDFDKKELKKIEQKPADKKEHKFKVGDEIKAANEESLTITKIDDKGYWSVDLFICDFDEECLWDLVEQKPAWSEEDETTKNNISHIIRQYDKISKRENQPCWYVGDCLLWMQNIKDRVQPQQEWSEEDEKMLNVVIKSCEQCGNEYAYYWLKSLKDRVQPKQELSKEDELKIGDIRDAITLDDELEESYKEKLYDFLKSLRPQNTWKPSEEQLGVIEAVINNRSFQRRHLDSLYEQLKKLKS